jgi:hypothetical protein
VLQLITITPSATEMPGSSPNVTSWVTIFLNKYRERVPALEKLLENDDAGVSRFRNIVSNMIDVFLEHGTKICAPGKTPTQIRMHLAVAAAYSQINCHRRSTDTFKSIVINTIHTAVCKALGKDQNWTTAQDVHNTMQALSKTLNKSLASPGAFGVDLVTQVACSRSMTAIGDRWKEYSNKYTDPEGNAQISDVVYEFATNMSDEHRQQVVPVPFGDTGMFQFDWEGHDLVGTTLDAIFNIIFQSFVPPASGKSGSADFLWSLRGDLPSVPWLANKQGLSVQFPLQFPLSLKKWNDNSLGILQRVLADHPSWERHDHVKECFNLLNIACSPKTMDQINQKLDTFENGKPPGLLSRSAWSTAQFDVLIDVHRRYAHKGVNKASRVASRKIKQKFGITRSAGSCRGMFATQRLVFTSLKERRSGETSTNHTTGKVSVQRRESHLWTKSMRSILQEEWSLDPEKQKSKVVQAVLDRFKAEEALNYERGAIYVYMKRHPELRTNSKAVGARTVLTPSIEAPLRTRSGMAHQRSDPLEEQSADEAARRTRTHNKSIDTNTKAAFRMPPSLSSDPPEHETVSSEDEDSFVASEDDEYVSEDDFDPKTDGSESSTDGLHIKGDDLAASDRLEISKPARASSKGFLEGRSGRSSQNNLDSSIIENVHVDRRVILDLTHSAEHLDMKLGAERTLHHHTSTTKPEFLLKDEEKEDFSSMPPIPDDFEPTSSEKTHHKQTMANSSVNTILDQVASVLKRPARSQPSSGSIVIALDDDVVDDNPPTKRFKDSPGPTSSSTFERYSSDHAQLNILYDRVAIRRVLLEGQLPDEEPARLSQSQNDDQSDILRLTGTLFGGRVKNLW